MAIHEVVQLLLVDQWSMCMCMYICMCMYTSDARVPAHHRNAHCIIRNHADLYHVWMHVY